MEFSSVVSGHGSFVEGLRVFILLKCFIGLFGAHNLERQLDNFFHPEIAECILLVAHGFREAFEA